MSQAGLVINSGGGGGGGVFPPNQTVQDFDDFIDNNGSNAGKFLWGSISGFSASPIAGTATNPGIVSIAGPNSTAPVANGLLLGFPSTIVSPFVLGGGSYSQNFVFNLNTLSNNTNSYTLYIGLMDYEDVVNLTSPQSGCWFQYNHTVNSGNWQIVCSNSSSQTVHNTSTTAATGFHNYGIQVNAAATSVAFTIDGVIVANSPITTNIPTSDIGPGIFIFSLAGTTADMYADLFYYTQILTTPR
jgi:hypothetical protein